MADKTPAEKLLDELTETIANYEKGEGRACVELMHIAAIRAREMLASGALIDGPMVHDIGPKRCTGHWHSPGIGPQCCLEEGHEGPCKYRCCSETCPGYVTPASVHAHPCPAS